MMTSEEVTVAAFPMQQAMNNILVLNNLFQYWDSNALRKIRLVSRRWNEVAAKLLQERNHSIVFRTTRRLQMFTELAKTSSNLPAQNFKFRLHYEDTIPSGSDEQTTAMKEFFEMCNELIVDLSMAFFWKLCDVNKLGKRLELIPSIMLPRMENLRTFTFEFVHFMARADIVDCLHIWIETYLPPLLAAISNISKLTVKNREESWNLTLHVSYDEVTTAFFNNMFQLTYLSDLTLDCRIVSDENIESLCSLHLKSFHIDISDTTFQNEIFTKFLKSQTDTLEYLDIFESFTHTASKLILQFPCMNALKSLMVSQGEKIVFDQIRLEFSTIWYAVMFPKLEKLVYKNPSKILAEGFLTPSRTMRELGLHCFTSDDHSIISEIVQNFVALKKLEIACGKVCEDIFRHLVDLEELTLLYCDKFHAGVMSNNLDELFTGYAIRDHHAVRICSLNGIKRKPHIGLLENLKVLRLHVALYDNSTNVCVKTLTDFSVYHGFLQMDSLQLFITAANLSKRCIEDMEEKYRVIMANRCELESMKFPKYSR